MLKTSDKVAMCQSYSFEDFFSGERILTRIVQGILKLDSVTAYAFNVIRKPRELLYARNTGIVKRNDCFASHNAKP